ncbi:hypothetical protein [Nonomuraea maheshkhaliensis]
MNWPLPTTPEEFVEALAAGGMPFADDDPAFCPVHGWHCEEGCPR